MAHFFHPYTGTPLSSLEVIAEGQAKIALSGGGPAPDYYDLDVTFDPARPGSITPTDGLDVGGNNRIFWINGPAAGASLRALTAEGNDYAQRVSITKVAGYYRGVPLGVRQDHNKSECWAAALSAWLQVTPGRPKFSKKELVDKYADLEDDGLSEQALTTQIVQNFGMGWWASRTKSAGYVDLLPSSPNRETKAQPSISYLQVRGAKLPRPVCLRRRQSLPSRRYCEGKQRAGHQQHGSLVRDGLSSSLQPVLRTSIVHRLGLLGNNVSCATPGSAMPANCRTARDHTVEYRQYKISADNKCANGDVAALYVNTPGSNNTTNGIDALRFNTSGDHNTAGGLGARSSNTTGKTTPRSAIRRSTQIRAAATISRSTPARLQP